MKSSSAESDLSRLVMQTSRAQMAAVMSRLAERGHEVNPSFAQVMPFIDTEVIRITTLAQRVTKQAIGQVVQQLRDFNYVEQVKDPSDARARIIRLTPRGVEANQVCADMRAELNQAATAALGAKALAKLNADLVTILGLIQSTQKT
jgi:hypothetical protein